MQVKKQQLELGMEKWTGSKLGNEYVKVSPYLFNFYAQYIMWNAWWITSWNLDSQEKYK